MRERVPTSPGSAADLHSHASSRETSPRSVASAPAAAVGSSASPVLIGTALSGESAASVSPGKRSVRALSRKFSSNKLILSAEPLTDALPGEIILPAELAEFGGALSEDGQPLEIQFSGKSARLPRSLSRHRNLSQADELPPANSGLSTQSGQATPIRPPVLTGDAGIEQAVEALHRLEVQPQPDLVSGQISSTPSSDLEVHISGKSARSIKRLASRQSLVEAH
ncbi:hypothetical protein WJX72_004722 [[Myrmecia] bisecta]|uniref:Uncharacterized protein n=1 Tax=[Myrmecia] bisecta TaxID=41462 RepID=A0AAW1R6J4_9CHLO